METFAAESRNELTNLTRNTSMIVSGATTAPATNVTINGVAGQTYSDFTFAGATTTLTNGSNTFTVIAQDIHGTNATNALTVSLSNSVSFQYDGNGNLTSDGTRTFIYDFENQLTNVFVSNAWRVDFVYDGLRRRRITRDYSWSGSTWTPTNQILYVYDGNVVLQERQSNSTVQVTVTYTRGRDMAGHFQGAGGIGGLLARTDSNGSTFYHADDNGNVTALTDANENVVARYLYDPFGRVLGQWGPLASVNTMQFSSMPHDGPSGLTVYRYRCYDPTFQRWLNRDPIGERGGLNLYAFVGNSPLNVVDAFGWAGCTNSSPKSWLGKVAHAFGAFLYGTPGAPSADSYAALRDEELGPTDFSFADLAGVTGDVVNSVAETAAPFLIPEVGLAEEGAVEVAEAFELGSSAAEGGGTTLFRVVGPDELSGIQQAGRYTGSPGGLEVKYFYPTAEQGANFAANPANAQFGPFTLTSTEVPTSVLNSSTAVNVATEGRVITIPNGQLPGLGTPTIHPSIPLPGH